MVKPGAIGALALGGLSWVAAGIAGNVSDRVLSGVTRGFKDQVAGLRGLPENHDVAKAVRTAQIQALERSIRDFADLHGPGWKVKSSTPAAIFIRHGLAFCTRTMDRRANLADELSLEVTEPLTAAIDVILAGPAHDGPASHRAGALALFCESVVLDELRTELDSIIVPEAFVLHFRSGSGGRPRFLDLFGAFVAEQIKSDERFRAILTIGRLSDSEALAFDTVGLVAAMDKRFGAALRKVDRKVDAVSADIAEILRIVSDRQGVPLATLQAILASFGELNVALDPGQIEQKLSGKATEYLALSDRLNRLSNADPEVSRLRREANAALATGGFDEADKLLAQAEARDLAGLEDLESFVRQKRLSAAESRVERAAAAKLRIAYREAATHYAEAAHMVAPADIGTSRDYRVDQGVVLHTLGKEFGDNGALREAILHFKTLLAELDHSADPTFWARTENHLGTVRFSLGERESGTERLEEAVVAYRAALQERTRERVPLQWAGTLNNLGNALRALGERESGTVQLEEAAVAYRAALQERTRERVPLQWAGTLNDLGNALRALGERESGTARLEDAVAAFDAALEERNRERVPLDWAETQNNLGNALSVLGERERGTARLEEAVADYRAALQEWTRDRVPLQWAMAQSNLGNALSALAERQSGTARLEEAVAALRAALEERTRERVPLEWATTQNNIGVTLHRLAQRERNVYRLEEAVAAFRAALKERTRERVLRLWALTENNLGAALANLTDYEGGPSRLQEAIGAFHKASTEPTSDRDPLNWAMTQNSLGIALARLGEGTMDSSTIKEAAGAYHNALKVFEEFDDIAQIGVVRDNLSRLARNLDESV